MNLELERLIISLVTELKGCKDTELRATLSSVVNGDMELFSRTLDHLVSNGQLVSISYEVHLRRRTFYIPGNTRVWLKALRSVVPRA